MGMGDEQERDMCLKCRENLMEHIRITRELISDYGEATNRKLGEHDEELRDLSTLLTRVVTIQEIQTKMAEEQRQAQTQKTPQVTEQKWFLVMVVVFSVVLLASVSAAIGVNLFDRMREIGGMTGV